MQTRYHRYIAGPLDGLEHHRSEGTEASYRVRYLTGGNGHHAIEFLVWDQCPEGIWEQIAWCRLVCFMRDQLETRRRTLTPPRYAT